MCVISSSACKVRSPKFLSWKSIVVSWAKTNKLCICGWWINVVNKQKESWSSVVPNCSAPPSPLHLPSSLSYTSKTISPPPHDHPFTVISRTQSSVGRYIIVGYIADVRLSNSTICVYTSYYIIWQECCRIITFFSFLVIMWLQILPHNDYDYFIIS